MFKVNQMKKVVSLMFKVNQMKKVVSLMSKTWVVVGMCHCTSYKVSNWGCQFGGTLLFYRPSTLGSTK